LKDLAKKETLSKKEGGDTQSRQLRKKSEGNRLRKETFGTFYACLARKSAADLDAHEEHSKDPLLDFWRWAGPRLLLDVRGNNGSRHRVAIKRDRNQSPPYIQMSKAFKVTREEKSSSQTALRGEVAFYG